jgi:hypothetical protein
MTASTPADAIEAPPDQTVVRDPGSYRDPGGFVYRRNGILYRQIGPASIKDWEGFVASGLAERLITAGRLVGHETIDLAEAATPSARAVIRPDPVEFISYPYEWTFGELKDAALLTLDAQLEALDAGWTLKDASAYNVQFRDARPIMIDSLSFEPYVEGEPWVAYRQFCEHFLAPLALVSRRDVRLTRLLRADPDGVPLDLAARLLPGRTRLNIGLLSHIHLHAGAQRRYAENEDEGAAAKRARIDNGRLTALVKNLRNTVAALEPNSTANLTVFRGGRTRNVRVTIGEMERSAAKTEETTSPETTSGGLGLSVEALTPELARQIGHKGELKGVVVTEVGQDSVAASTVRPGDIILAVGSTTINNVRDFREATTKLDLKQGVRLQIVREGFKQFVFLKS